MKPLLQRFVLAVTLIFALTFFVCAVCLVTARGSSVLFGTHTAEVRLLQKDSRFVLESDAFTLPLPQLPPGGGAME